MSQIKISCVGSTAVFTNTPNIFSGGNVDEVKFEFDKEWVDFPYKTAVFYTNPKETALQILDTDNVAKIPPNMLSQKGKLSIGVIGTNINDEVKTSKILTYLVGKGAITNDMETTAPTPDIWLQMLAIVKHNKDVVDNMNLLVDESQLPNKANKDLSNVSVDTFLEKGLYSHTESYTGTNEVTNVMEFDFEPRFIMIICPETNEWAFLYKSLSIIARLRQVNEYAYFEYKGNVRWEQKSAILTADLSRDVMNDSDFTYHVVAFG